MTSVQGFLSSLKDLDIQIWLEGDRLRCNAPKGVLNPLLRAELAERKSEIITFLQQAQQRSPSITPLPRNGHLPLSPAQTRLWFLDRLEGSSANYNMTTALRLSGHLNQMAFDRSLEEIARRHEILRTTFEIVEGSPVQVIAPQPRVNLMVLDWQHLSDDRQTEAFKGLVVQEERSPFDLAQDVLVRVKLIQLARESSILLVTMHHIITDGWSMGIFVQEFMACYGAFCAGKSPALPPLAIQYADFAHWQQQWLTGKVLESQLSYWKQQLALSPPLLDLPTDYPRPSRPTFRGSSESFVINSQLTEQLGQMSQQWGATLYMTLLGAFAILLSRYSSQEDIVIGSPIANRNHRDIEALIGFFVNTLLLRLDLSNQPTFLTLLGRVRQVALDAYAHQDVPFEKLVEELQPERSLSYSPLFQVMFAFQNAPTGKLELPGLTLTPLELETVTAKFELTLSMQETPSGLVGTWEYNQDLFAAETICRMSEHFQTLLSAIVISPEQPIGQLTMLTQAERQQLLLTWNETQTDYPSDSCIHQLFEAQVERSPNAVAVVFKDTQLTYRELNERANQLAHALQTLGVQPEGLVGICVGRSIEMVVGLLGIWKAGGAYLPLDPNYPPERLSYMLDDAQVSLLLTQQSLISQLPEFSGQRLLLDKDCDIISQNPSENPVSNAKAENLAYVIYTSGSTGKPKGVLLAHRGLCNLAVAQIEAFEVDPSSRVLQFSSCSFDASISEIVMALCSGASLYLDTLDRLLPGTDLMTLLRERAITHVTLPPSALAALPSPQLPALTSLIVAGETCGIDLMERWSSGRRFYNAYGPTESTVCATIARCTNIDRQPPIGRPINNLQVYILDRYLQPVPIGVPGELYIGGVGLARGYLNRPELTQEKFIPHPFSHDPKARLYKTGDLARYLSDGNIEFLGRIDHQVKLRGFRIELGEIEAILNQFPKIREAVAIIREDIPTDRRLVAYVVSRDEHLSSQELRNFLKEKLPEYMVPSAFVFLEAMPLTPNGKIDRRALPAPSGLSKERSDRFVAPRNDLERQLAQLWSVLLNTYPVGVQDNFFDLGGHSLLAVRLMTQIQQQFGRHLPLATLFQSPTVEDLARVLRSTTEGLSRSPLVAIQPQGDLPPFFCVPGAGGNVIYFYELARHLGLDRPFYGLQALGLDGRSEPWRRVEEMAAYYLQSIQSIQPQGPYWLGGHSFGGQVAFEMAQQLQRQGQSVALVALLDTPAPVANDPIITQDWHEDRWLSNLASLIESWLEIDLGMSDTLLRSLTPDEQLTYFKERLQQVNLLPPESDITQVRGLVNVFKANYQAHYVPTVVSPTHVVLFASEDASLEDPIWRWQSFSASVVTYRVPGNHMTMMASPHVQSLARQLRICLDRTQGV